ncbi:MULTISPECIES: sirohydrochlorin chelatase [unclassified Janthinobacterium]|uniref:sirohydrochlorin chelatase n=1 Tax=unclassified Janthinobacterium TaxID=2610881 RepID=UPI0008F5037B|nr:MULTISPECIES: CbiX/SirB N-terminal domain-containing protein [unclassified Janthinobacterium]APA69604.1 cobalamin biosynthesis protein CbiX [Janthinobacterium sp. 1_2014MBL_MicDiv]MDN2712051.1 CbiX/SirB N-terminal domain-containing protein [Janthinobacterium sp. SUN118]
MHATGTPAAGAQQALILFAHGARAASWAAPFERLRELTQARMPATSVHLAFLELMTPRLPELVQALLAELPAGATLDVTVVPVFLGQGGHVLRDLPLLAEELRQRHPQLRLNVVEAVGENAGVLAAIADYCVAAPGATQSS